MEKALECGIRIKEAELQKSDEDFKKFVNICGERVGSLIEAQRNSYLGIVATTSTKAIDGFTPFKAIELYCSVKGDAQIFTPEDKGIECGIRIKEFALDLPDDAFKVVLGGCVDIFKESVMQQRSAYQVAKSSKSVELEDATKGVEFYCSVKSMCS